LAGSGQRSGFLHDVFLGVVHQLAHASVCLVPLLRPGIKERTSIDLFWENPQYPVKVKPVFDHPERNFALPAGMHFQCTLLQG
jgi:hypothetical protein